jgi:hypothetical protein
MRISTVFALLFVLVSLSLAAAEHLTRGAAGSSIADRDEAVTVPSNVAADTDEAAPNKSYWVAWAEAAAH